MPKMRAAQVVSAKGPYQIVEREIPQPDAGQVRIRVQASGICHSDALTKEGYCATLAGAAISCCARSPASFPGSHTTAVTRTT